MAWPEGKWRAYQSAFKTLSITVDGQERRAVPWTDWSLTTRIDTEAYWPTVWSAISCHKTQMAIYESLESLSPEHHKALWGAQEFYRVFSLANGGRKNETDLFEGIRDGTLQVASQALVLSPPGGTRHSDSSPERESNTVTRKAILDMPANQFRTLGHDLVERIGDFLDGIRSRKVTNATTNRELREVLEKLGPLPDEPSETAGILAEVAEQLFRHSLHNGHPRFWGYITSSAAPIGMLADLLAASVNANVGAAALSPLATQIEADTIRWIAQILGYPDDCGGILVSGGNMANLVCLLVARGAKLGSKVRSLGVGHATQGRPRIYASSATHTWIEKGADIAGLGTESICWIPADRNQRIDVAELERQIQRDLECGNSPFS